MADLKYKERHVFIGVYVKPEEREALRRSAKKTDMSVSQFVRKRLRRWMR